MPYLVECYWAVVKPYAPGGGYPEERPVARAEVCRNLFDIPRVHSPIQWDRISNSETTLRRPAESVLISSVLLFFFWLLTFHSQARTQSARFTSQVSVCPARQRFVLDLFNRITPPFLLRNLGMMNVLRQPWVLGWPHIPVWKTSNAEHSSQYSARPPLYTTYSYTDHVTRYFPVGASKPPPMPYSKRPRVQTMR